MNNQIVGYNVVVVARQFNPSVLSQLWLVRNGIVGEDEFGREWIFAEPFVQVKTEQFTLGVVPEQIQFAPMPLTVGSGESEEELIIDKLGTIVARLPHTPYVAVGFNFVWHLTPQSSELKRLSRHLFFKEGSEIFGEFNTEDARFGGYLSKNFLDGRLRLDVKPLVPTNELAERFQFAFNYNKDITDQAKAAETVGAALRTWNAAKAESRRIVESIANEVTK